MSKNVSVLVLLFMILIMTVGCQSSMHNETTEASLDTASKTNAPPLWPDNIMEGTWEGEAWRINSRGASHILDRLTITCEPHGLLKVNRTWRTLDGAGGHKGRTPVMSDDEELVGVFDQATGHFRLVEMDEPGTMDGYLVDRNTIDFFSTQPGRQPSTSHERLQRKTDP
ncbi:MAG: hypothetical protein VX527_10860 [Planctomycetota bacterium]|nr:hypothetical protein [Planctomycetota bacterium]